jgi:hypothetical protein
MTLNSKKLKLKKALEKLGYRVYFSQGKVKLSRPWSSTNGVDWFTFREAYRLSKGIAGSGKTVNPAKHIAKRQTQGLIRAKIRDVIKTETEDISVSPKEVFEPWCYE